VRTVVDPLLRAEAMHGPRTAVVCRDIRRTFAEICERCHRLGGLLDQLGLEPGARVALLAANSAEYPEIYAGVPAAGRMTQGRPCSSPTATRAPSPLPSTR
jgi:fatty-acyl-CoA synthase